MVYLVDYPAEYQKNIEEIFLIDYEAGSFKKPLALARGGSYKINYLLKS